MKLSGLIPGHIDAGLKQILQSVVSAFDQITTFENWRWFEKIDSTGKPNLYLQRRKGTDWETTANAGDAIASVQKIATIYNTATAQSIPNGTFTTINFDTKLLDTNNAVTTGANWKFTVPVTGLYYVSATVGLNVPTSTNYDYFACITVNGTEVQRGIRVAANTGSSNVLNSGALGLVNVSRNDAIAIQIYQSSSATRTLDGFAGSSRISIYRIPGN